MFQRANEQVGRFVSAGGSQDSQVVRFGAAAGENKLKGFAARQKGKVFSGVFHRLAYRLGVGVVLPRKHEVR